MLIVCPSCASRYELDGSKLGPAGRKVRCASCQTLWHVEPETALPDVPSADEMRTLLNAELERATEIDGQVSALVAERSESSLQPDEPTQPDMAAPGEIESTPAPRKRPSAGKARAARNRVKDAGAPRGLAAPAMLALAGLALIGVLVWQRNLVVRAAPQLAAAFETFGLPVNIRGLSLTSVESGLVDDGQGRFLVVEGDVTNIIRSSAQMPPIEVAVRDATGQTLYTWTTDPPRPSLEPSELVRFRVRLAAPPEAGRSVQVRFASAKPTGLASAK